MELIDYNTVSELALQKLHPVYVIDEETKEILFTNRMLDKMMGCSLKGENCYEAFFGDASYSSVSPPERAPGETYQWDYADKKMNKLFKILDLWFESNGRRCRMGIITDTSDLMDLNRSMADYLWLMQELTQMQIRMAREQNNAIPPLLDFFRKHYGAERAVISFFEKNMPRTFMSDESGIHDLKAFYNSKEPPFNFTVDGHNFSLWIENMKNAEAWEDDRDYVMPIAKLHIENSILWQRLNWENCHDRLTGLLSRSSLDDYVRGTFNSSDRIGILYADIDELKRINDYHGHEMGDALIKKASEVLLKLTNEHVYGFRMGGDEFMLVCVGYEAEQMETLSQTLEALVEDINREKPVPKLSLSSGRACGRQPFTFEAVMRAADERMYEVKREKKAKRNKILGA